MPQNTRDLLADPRFVSRSNVRRANTLTLRECFTIDSEALEFFLSGETIKPWAAVTAEGKVVEECESRDQAEALVKAGKAARAAPLSEVGR